MKSLFTTGAMASVLLALGSVSADAQIHFDFTNGLSGWTTTGDVAHRTVGGNGHAALTTAHSTFDDDAPLPVGALNLSGIDPVSAFFDLDAFAGLPLGSLDRGILDQATEGSAMQFTFNVSAGDRLTFDWQFLTLDPGLDYAFVSIDGAFFELGGAWNATLPGSGDFAQQTALSSFAYTFDASGPVILTIGIVDVGDYSASSMLTIDNLSIAAVPEPHEYGMALAAFLGAVAFARRLRARRV